MISRHWKGTVMAGLADDYLRHLRAATLPQLVACPGFISVSILRRPVHEGTEFQVVTLWESLAAIRDFAGDDADAAVVPAEAQAMMSEFDARVSHYDVVDIVTRR
jgi:heme-degrading monooxygenase HmoA